MIVKVRNDGDHDYFSTNGCGCCSVDYYPSVEYWEEDWNDCPIEGQTPEQMAESNRSKILTHLKENIQVTREVCEKLGIDFQTLITEA